MSTAAAPFLPAGTFTGLHLPELLPREACQALVAQLERRGFQPTGNAYPGGYRDNDRLVFEDAELADRLFALTGPLLPAEQAFDGSTWRIAGLNPRFRACRYRDGQGFCVHRDGPYEPNGALRSWLTLQLYLSDAPPHGGRTRFYADARGTRPWAAVDPVCGAAIAFDHRAWHDGEPVSAGTKYVLRTDVLYRRSGPAASEAAAADRTLVGRHRGYVWRVLARRDGTFASSGRDGTVRLWQPEGQGFRETLHDLQGGSVTALTEDASGRLWCGTRAGTLALPDAGGFRRLLDVGAAILDLTALEDGGIAASLASGEVASFTARGELRWRRAVHSGWAWSLSAGAGHLRSCGEDGLVAVLDADGAARPLARHTRALRALALHPSGLLLAGDSGGGVRALGPAGDVAWQVVAHGSAVTALARGTDGGWLSAGEDGRVRAWQSERCQATWGTPDFVRSVAVTRSGEVLFGGYDGGVWLARATGSAPRSRASAP